jgi:hypothetical protein
MLSHSAGWFDGEGCISSSVRKGGNLAIVASISNTYYRGLEHFKKTFGGQIVEMKTQKEEHKKCWQWRLQKFEDILNFLERVTPYLQDKQSQGEYALGVLKHLQKRLGKRITPEDRATFIRYNNELRAMKRDADRLSRSSVPHGFDQPELTVGTTRDELGWALCDKDGRLMFAWNSNL